MVLPPQIQNKQPKLQLQTESKASTDVYDRFDQYEQFGC